MMCFLVLGFLTADATAGKARKTYVFLVSDVALEKRIPPDIADLVRKQLTRAIDKHDRLIAALPPDAPDPTAHPKKFRRYIARHKLKPFRVNVEVIEYSHEVDESAQGRQLTVSIALRTFGETIPQRVMAFSGEGSAKIRMDIGKTLRPRDTRVAKKDAAELAVADALALSLKRLEAGGKKKRKKNKRKKNKQKK